MRYHVRTPGGLAVLLLFLNGFLAVRRTSVVDRRVSRRGARARRRRGHRGTDRLDPVRHWDRVVGDAPTDEASRPTGGLRRATT